MRAFQMNSLGLASFCRPMDSALRALVAVALLASFRVAALFGLPIFDYVANRFATARRFTPAFLPSIALRTRGGDDFGLLTDRFGEPREKQLIVAQAAPAHTGCRTRIEAFSIIFFVLL